MRTFEIETDAICEVCNEQPADHLVKGVQLVAHWKHFGHRATSCAKCLAEIEEKPADEFTWIETEETNP
ncbi:hypothetical protein [Aureliella helgolandensis]|uniref:Uncharacterized protein n=1 Tax=Aureliella helgolandensis TaxID=2527968 RepID=A0A518G742_9BACT|nr:hypothetical protein [Aureliella helgolandensis]QDV24410.1 hypothetical protein Q31a_27270 [Aureliella helgolandensis]